MSIGRVPGATGIQPSIVTAKGDLIVATASGSVINQPVGTNNQVLMADSAQADGVKWANEATSTLTTTGDILYASAANTLARRAIGSTGDVLTVSGGLPTWAAPASGSMTQLATGSLSGSTTTISSIVSGYQHLYLRLNGVSISAQSEVRLQINGVATNYRSNIGSGNTALNIAMGVGGTDTKSSAGIWFFDYLKTGCYKIIQFNVFSYNDSGWNSGTGAGSTQDNTAAITSIGILANSGTFDAGTYELFGVK